MTRFDDLSPELLAEIMSWLPPESLKQFKFVQKSWCLLIKVLMADPIFIAKHLCNMKTKMLSTRSYCFKYLLTVQLGNKSGCSAEEKFEKLEEDDDYDYDYDYDDDGEEEEEEEEEEEDDNSDDDAEEEEYAEYLLVLANDYDNQEDYVVCDTDDLRELMGHRTIYDFKVASQCDGIICLYKINSYGQGTAFLMNPSLQEMRIIHCSCAYTDYELRGVGFGYDLNAHEYKIVAFFSLPISEEDDGPYTAGVYSMSSNSWREIEFGAEMLNMFNGEHDEVYCNGVCYWYYWDYGLRMFSFHFSDEVFHNVAVPVVTRESIYEFSTWTKICVWKDSVVLFTYPENSPMIIDMWVLNSKSDNAEGSCSSWTKHLTIGPLEGIKRPLGFWDDVELFMEAEGGVIKFYRLDRGIVGHTSMQLEWFCNYCFVINQISLVSVLRKDGRR